MPLATEGGRRRSGALPQVQEIKRVPQPFPVWEFAQVLACCQQQVRP